MTITTPTGKRIIVVPVPDVATNIRKWGKNLFYEIDSKILSLDPQLIPYEGELLGTITSGVPDFDCEDIVEKATHPEGNGFIYRLYPEGICSHADDSFISFLESQGMKFKNKYGEEPKSKPLHPFLVKNPFGDIILSKQGRDQKEKFIADHDQWQSEESQVIKKAVVIEIKEK